MMYIIVFKYHREKKIVNIEITNIYEIPKYIGSILFLFGRLVLIASRFTYIEMLTAKTTNVMRNIYTNFHFLDLINLDIMKIMIINMIS